MSLDVAAQLERAGLARPSRIELDKYHYLIDHLLRAGTCRREHEFCPIHFDTFRKVVGYHFAAAILRNSVAAGIAECDGEWRAGFKSIGYRLQLQHFDGTCAKVPIWRQSFAEKLERHHAESERAVLSNPTLAHIAACVRRLTLDCEAADAYVEDAHAGRELATRKLAIDTFRERTFTFSLDRQGRFYHAFIRLSRDCRQFATLSGEPLVQLDYSALQPALLTTLYPKDCDERQRFHSANLHGLYQFLADRIAGMRFDLSDPMAKRKFKDLVFGHFLYCDNNVRSAMRDVWERNFPVLSQLIVAAKHRDHGDLARMMQKAEAQLVLGRVVPTLVERLPGIPIITVHDCLVTTPRFEKEVHAAMTTAAIQFCGFSIQVKADLLTVGCDAH